MSLISEALKKAQEERDGLRDQAYSPQMEHKAQRVTPPLWKSPLVVVAGLALLLGLLAVWLTRPAAKPVTTQSVPLVQMEAQQVPTDNVAHTEPTKLGETELRDRESPQQKTVVEQAPAETDAQQEPLPKQMKPVETPSSSHQPGPIVKAESEAPEVSEDDELAITLRTAETADDYVRLYQMLQRRGEVQQAFDMIKTGLESFPENGLLNQLALIGYVRSRNYEKGLIHSAPALKVDPDNPSLLTYRGLCYFHLKDFPRALADFTRSLALDQEATENIYYLALIYDNQRQYDLAVRYHRMFLDHPPADRSFRHKDYILDRLGQLERHRKQS